MSATLRWRGASKRQTSKRVKNHLFYARHTLDSYVGLGIAAVQARFDSDYEIAQAWQRLQFGDGPFPPEIEELDAPGTPTLSAEDVRREVCAGIEEESQRLKMAIPIRRIQFVASDSRPVAIYRDLTRALVRHFWAATASPNQPASRLANQSSRRHSSARPRAQRSS
jgi:hypothetical protein